MILKKIKYLSDTSFCSFYNREMIWTKTGKIGVGSTAGRELDEKRIRD